MTYTIKLRWPEIFVSIKANDLTVTVSIGVFLEPNKRQNLKRPTSLFSTKNPSINCNKKILTKHSTGVTEYASSIHQSLVASPWCDGVNLTKPKVWWTTRGLLCVMKLLHSHCYCLKLSFCVLCMVQGLILKAFNVINLIWSLPLKVPYTYFEIREGFCNKAVCLWDCKTRYKNTLLMQIWNLEENMMGTTAMW